MFAHKSKEDYEYAKLALFVANGYSQTVVAVRVLCHRNNGEAYTIETDTVIWIKDRRMS